MSAQREVDRPTDFIDFVEMLWAGRKKIIITSVVFLCIGVALGFALQPIYRASETLHVREQMGGAGALESLAGQFGALGSLASSALGGSHDELNVALATLKSRAIIENFITRNSLMPLLYSGRWDKRTKQWSTWLPDRVPNVQDAYKKFTSKILDVSDDKSTNLITVAVEWKDPSQAASWVSQIVADTNEALREKAVDESQANIAYLKAQAQQTTIVPVQLALYGLMDTEYKKLMIAKNAEDPVFRVVDPVEVPLRKARPKRTLLAVEALSLGFVLGVLYVLLENAVRARNSAVWDKAARAEPKGGVEAKTNRNYKGLAES